MQLSPQQLAFRQKLQDEPQTNIILVAVAGSGKTTSMIGNLDVLQGSTAAMAFNKKISVEWEAKISKLPPMVRLNVEVGTVHSFGFRAWKQGGMKSRVEAASQLC
jgi:superfamily I DNA/RNA helicase